MPIIARHYQSGYPLSVEIVGTKYGTVTELETVENEDKLPWIAPGLIDIQVNGFAGVDFNSIGTGSESAEEEEEGVVPGLWEAEVAWQMVTEALYACGCTGFLVTLITTSPEQYAQLLPRWTACLQNDPRNGLGIHLEGPWLNPEEGYRGAHPAQHMVLPDVAQLAQYADMCAGGLRMITLAPELDPEAAALVIQEARKRGILCFLGHSGAMGEILHFATTAGAQGWTHLGNAAPRVADKFENVILHVLAETSLYASLIPDGLHLPPHAFKALTQALGDQMILTTDAMSAAGAWMVEGLSMKRPFRLGETVVKLGEDGTARMPETGRLAGSTLTPFEAVCRAADMAEVPWALVWNAYSTVPAALLGFQHGIEEGNSADFCLLPAEEDPRLLATYHRGVKVYEDLETGAQ